MVLCSILITPGCQVKLYFNKTSPFSRKVRVLVCELKLESIQHIDTGLISPVMPNEAVIAVNPVGKVPVLVLDDGQSLTDSRVICEFVDSLGSGAFFPRGPDARFRSLHLQALADDILNTAVATRYELAHRPGELIWGVWVEMQKLRMSRTIDYFNRVVETFVETPTIGEVAVGCVLGYIDFRELDVSWRERNPHLSAWFDQFDRRDSMKLTRPGS
ncbi:MAG: glutathione S-transferase family protein [Gammaproteobacteria bacterium]|nr:glutathione S-transferase family protein [Gammaproteobacteria bacterium]